MNSVRFFSALMCLILASCGSTPAASSPSSEESATPPSSDSTALSSESLPASESSQTEFSYENPPELVTIDRMDYRLKEDGTYEVCSHKYSYVDLSTPNTVTIPEKVYGRPVTSLADYGFQHYFNARYVTLPDTIEYIGHYAFYETYLEEANIPKSLAFLGDFAFGKVYLTRPVILPKTLSHVGIGAFWKTCYAHIELESDNPWLCYENHVLYNKDKTELIAYCESELDGDDYYHFVVPPTVTKIRDYSISAWEFDEITIPSSVKTIGKNALRGTNSLNIVHLNEGLEGIGEEAFPFVTTPIRIPHSVRSIGHNAFKTWREGNPQASVDDDHPRYRIECGCLIEKTTETVLMVIENMAEYAFSDGLLAVGDYAFSECHGKLRFSFPDSVQHMGSYVFAVRLEIELPFSLPKGLRTMGDHTFQSNCKFSENLTLSIGKCLESIGEAPFCNVFSLEAFDVDEDNPYFSDYKNCLYSKDKTILYCVPSVKIQDFSIHEETVRIKHSASWNVYNGPSLVIPRNVTHIEPYAFYMSGMQTVELPRGIQDVGDYAFGYATSLEVVYHGCEEEWANVKLGETALGKDPTIIFDPEEYPAE